MIPANIVRVAVLILAINVAADAYAQGSSPVAACNGRAVKYKCSSGVCELDLEIVGKPGCRLRIDDAWLRTHQQPRITEATSLKVRVVGANLLRYALKFETKEKVVDSYVDLEQLWRQVLTFIPDSVQRSRADRATPIGAWRLALAEEDSDVSAFIARFNGLTLTCGERELIALEVAKIPERFRKLERVRKEAFDEAAASGDFTAYDSTMRIHEAVVGRLKSFETRGAVAAGGFFRRVTFGEAGRIVTLTITMTDLAAGTDAGVAEIVEFFVHSTLPVTFHAGYSYSSLDAFEFERVAAATGEDLFAKINEGKGLSGFTAFLSYRIGNPERAPLRSEFFATLGTDLSDPGKHLFVGASARVKKVFVSGGIATAAVRDANDGDKINDVVGAVGNILGTRELFTRIHTTRQWRPFIAVSFAPF
jgi:hypothetical protein